MATMEVTNNDVGTVELYEPVYTRETLTATGAETWPKGSVLGRVTASNKLIRYTTGALDGSQVPKFVLQEVVTFAAAGDIKHDVIIGGQVRNRFLVDGADAALTPVALDTLRSYGIIAVDSEQLTELDNQ